MTRCIVLAAAIGITLVAICRLQHHVATTALIGAVNRGDARQTNELLKQGADANSRDPFNQSMIAVATQRGDLEVVRSLAEHGARLRIVDQYGFPPVATAAMDGRAELVRYLLARGADPDQPDKWGMTALMVASRNGRIEVVRTLIQAGASLNTRHKIFGYTALQFAQRGRQPSHRVIEPLLINAGAID